MATEERYYLVYVGQTRAFAFDCDRNARASLSPEEVDLYRFLQKSKDYRYVGVLKRDQLYEL